MSEVKPKVQRKAEEKKKKTDKKKKLHKICFPSVKPVNIVL